MDSTYFSGSYSSDTSLLSNGYTISSQTPIFYSSNNTYRLVESDDLDSNISGKIVLNENGVVDVFFLSQGLRTYNYLPPVEEKDTEDDDTDTTLRYTGTIYSVIKNVKNLDNNTTQVEFYNNDNIFYVSTDSEIGNKISSLKNSFVRTVIIDDKITSVNKVAADTDKVEISAIYSNQLQIDGITYMEYSSALKVYSCKLDSLGNIVSFNEVTKSSITAGSTAQLYDLYGNFDGIIDVLVLFNK
jgi:hypothetical protein